MCSANDASTGLIFGSDCSAMASDLPAETAPAALGPALSALCCVGRRVVDLLHDVGPLSIRTANLDIPGALGPPSDDPPIGKPATNVRPPIMDGADPKAVVVA